MLNGTYLSKFLFYDVYKTLFSLIFLFFSPETPYLTIKCLYISDDNNVKPSAYNLRKMLSIFTYFKQPKFTAQKWYVKQFFSIKNLENDGGGMTEINRN